MRRQKWIGNHTKTRFGTQTRQKCTRTGVQGTQFLETSVDQKLFLGVPAVSQQKFSLQHIQSPRETLLNRGAKSWRQCTASGGEERLRILAAFAGKLENQENQKSAKTL